MNGFGAIDDFHYVRKRNRLKPPYPAALSSIALGAGCFWGP